MDNIINLEQYKLIKKVREMAETVSNDTDLHLLSYYTSICDEFTSIMFQIENFKIREPEDFDIFDNMIKFFMDNILFFFTLEDEVINRKIKTSDECEVGKLCHSFMDRIVELKSKAYEEAKEHFNIKK